MIPPDKPKLDPLPPELLAGYADGELTPEANAAVERWIAAHPEALAELEAQREMGPTNAALWELAEPPEPTTAAWSNVQRGVEAGVNPAVPAERGRWTIAPWLLGTIATGGLVAAVAWIAFVIGGKPHQPAPIVPDVVREAPRSAPAIEVAQAPAPRTVVRTPEPDPLAGMAVLSMATDDDVVLDRVPDTGVGFLPIGEHPLPDVLELASFDEFNLENADPSSAWPNGEPQMTTEPGDSPMLYAARPR